VISETSITVGVRIEDSTENPQMSAEDFIAVNSNCQHLRWLVDLSGVVVSKVID
jgi:hypothetical protein